MNASIWDGDVVRQLRQALLLQHLGVDTGALNDRAAVSLYREVADGNRLPLECGEPITRGRAITLSPERYGQRPDPHR